MYKTFDEWGKMLDCGAEQLANGIMRAFTTILPTEKWLTWADDDKGEKYSTIIIFLVPALTLFTVFVVMPIFEAAYFSFYRWNGMGAPEKLSLIHISEPTRPLYISYAVF